MDLTTTCALTLVCPASEDHLSPKRLVQNGVILSSATIIAPNRLESSRYTTENEKRQTITVDPASHHR